MSFQSCKSQFHSKVQRAIVNLKSTSEAANDRLKYSMNRQERESLKLLLGEVETLQSFGRKVNMSTKFLDIVGAATETSKQIKQLRGIMTSLEADLHEIIIRA